MTRNALESGDAENPGTAADGPREVDRLKVDEGLFFQSVSGGVGSDVREWGAQVGEVGSPTDSQREYARLEVNEDVSTVVGDVVLIEHFKVA